MKRSAFFSGLLALILGSVLFTSCEKNLELLKTKTKTPSLQSGGKKTCKQSISFVDAGMCGGLWFQTISGDYLEVYGFPGGREELKLSPGDQISVDYEAFQNEGITCMALSTFESELFESGKEWKTVKLTCYTEEKCPGKGKCEEKFVFADPGLCSGIWFETPSDNVLEVYDYPSPQNLTPGQTYSFCFEAFDASGLIECEAICAYEVNARELGRQIETVRFTGH